MDKQKLEYFRNLLLEQRRQATDDLRNDRATALEGDELNLASPKVWAIWTSARCLP